MAEVTKGGLAEELKELEAALKTEKDAAKKKKIEDGIVEIKKEIKEISAAEVEVVPEVKEEVKDKHSLFFKESFWCKELSRSVRKGPYNPATKAEFDVLKKYAAVVEKKKK